MATMGPKAQATDDDGVRVRAATPTDVSELSHLRFQWRSLEEGERGLDEPAFERALAAWMSHHGSTHLPFLAERRGQPVGMAWLVLVDRVPGPERFVRRSAYVQSVYVIPAERGRGVGTSLVEFVLSQASGLDLDYLVVHPSDRSFSLYRRLGFRPTDRVLELR